MGGGFSKMAKQGLVATIRDRYQQSSKKDKGRKDCRRSWVSWAGSRLPPWLVWPPSAGTEVDPVFRTTA